MAVIELVGVVELGGTRDPTVPANPRKTIKIIKGETTTLTVVSQNSDGTLDTGATATAYFTIRKAPGVTPTLETQVTLDTDGVATFTVATADLSNAQAGRYLYDVVRVRGTDRQSIVPISPVIIQDTATPI